MGLRQVNEVLRGTIEDLTEVEQVKGYRVTVENPDFAKDNLARYKYEFFHVGKWRPLKNLSIRSKLRDMVVKNPKLIGKMIKK